LSTNNVFNLTYLGVTVLAYATTVPSKTQVRVTREEKMKWKNFPTKQSLECVAFLMMLTLLIGCASLKESTTQKITSPADARDLNRKIVRSTYWVVFSGGGNDRYFLEYRFGVDARRNNSTVFLDTNLIWLSYGTGPQQLNLEESTIDYLLPLLVYSGEFDTSSWKFHLTEAASQYSKAYGHFLHEVNKDDTTQPPLSNIAVQEKLEWSARQFTSDWFSNLDGRVLELDHTYSGKRVLFSEAFQTLLLTQYTMVIKKTTLDDLYVVSIEDIGENNYKRRFELYTSSNLIPWKVNVAEHIEYKTLTGELIMQDRTDQFQ